MSLDYESLARVGDMTKEAMALRLRAARMTTGLNQRGMADEIGIGFTTLNNMEQALTYPTRFVMRHFYRRYRIDFNFLLHGDYNQLPRDVQDALFEELNIAASQADRAKG